ncbi:hypothetical protein NLX86_32595 [Streptomyces sp. A3M-1-3]|nr:hypothetical protein [Streptomyces sp. A3M-1-3]MCP3822654.1 hypothetical protein [Streptomyces sp. A3M-1-3]
MSEKPLLPREVDDKLVPPHWRRAVYANQDLPQGSVDRDAYVVCVLEQLFRALKRRDIYASPSHRWSDPPARLLDGQEWDAVREDVLAGLSLDEDAEQHVRDLLEVLIIREKTPRRTGPPRQPHPVCLVAHGIATESDTWVEAGHRRLPDL